MEIANLRQKRGVRIIVIVALNPLIQIFIVLSTIVHRSDQQQLILQVPLQQPHLFSFLRLRRASPFLASPHPIVLRLVAGQLATASAAAEAEEELGGAEEREGGEEERD